MPIVDAEDVTGLQRHSDRQTVPAGQNRRVDADAGADRRPGLAAADHVHPTVAGDAPQPETGCRPAPHRAADARMMAKRMNSQHLSMSRQ